MLAVLRLSCGLLEPDAKSWPPVFEEVFPIITASCAACHNAGEFDGLMASAEALEEDPSLLDSTAVSYQKRVVVEHLRLLKAGIEEKPILDFTKPGNLAHYTNDIMAGRDNLCQRVQFHHFRPYHPAGMPPPYAAALAGRLNAAGGAYVGAWSDSGSLIGSWRDAHVDFDGILNFEEDGRFSTDMYWNMQPLPTDSTAGLWRGDSIFSIKATDTALIALLAFTGDTLVISDTAGIWQYPFVKILPDELMAHYASDVRSDATWQQLNMDALVADQCMLCHTSAGIAPLIRSVEALPDAGLPVVLRHHPGGIRRQLKGLGNAMMFVHNADFSTAEHIETFLSNPGEASVTVYKLQLPVHHDWAPGVMPPSWAMDFFSAVDPTQAQFPFTPLSDLQRKSLVAYIEGNLTVDPFEFDEMDLITGTEGADVGLPWEVVPDPDQKVPACGIVPFFPDAHADSLAGATAP